MAAKLFMSLRKTVVLMTLSMPLPAFSRMAFTLVRDWRVWPAMSAGNAPVAGSMGSWPEVNTRLPAAMPWE